MLVVVFKSGLGMSSFGDKSTSSSGVHSFNRKSDDNFDDVELDGIENVTRKVRLLLPLTPGVVSLLGFSEWMY